MIEEYHNGCLVFMLAKAYQHAHAELKKALSPLGITPVQLLIIATLSQEEGLSAGEIGKRLTLDSATLSGLLERMVDKGWVKKEQDPNDKRVVRVFLTPKAKDRQANILAERDRVNQELLQGFSTEERIILKRLLRDLHG